MFKRIAIISVSIGLVLLVVGVLFICRKDGVNPRTANDLLDKTAYLSKSKDSYSRCYNSINYGTSLIGDVRLQIKSENFNDDSINSDRLNIIEKSFMDTVVSPKCEKVITDYETAYEAAVADSHELEGHEVWNFFFGATLSQPATRDLSGFQSSRARMSIAFNDYVFTEQEVKDYFD